MVYYFIFGCLEDREFFFFWYYRGMVGIVDMRIQEVDFEGQEKFYCNDLVNLSIDFYY